MLADAGPAAGLGHLSRCTALAVALRCHGREVRTLAYGAVESTVVGDVRWDPLPEGEEPFRGEGAPVVLDSYRLPAAAAGALAAGGPLVAFHDPGQPAPPRGAMVISFAAEGPVWAAGARYACLRPEFWGLDQPRRGGEGPLRRALVAAGSGVLGGAGGVAAAVADALPGVEVRLVAGPYATEPVPSGVVPVHAPDGLRDELRAADLVVSAAGQTMLEALCAGTPCVAFAHADNQRGQLEMLAQAGAVAATQPERLAGLVAELAAAGDRRAALSEHGRATIDGFGALRLAARMTAP